MKNFEYVKHMVIKAEFEDKGKNRTGNAGLDVSGEAVLPKEGNGIALKYRVTLGKPEENMYLFLEMMTFFDYKGDKEEFDISKMQAYSDECNPIAKEKVRDTVRNVSETYGMNVLDLTLPLGLK